MSTPFDTTFVDTDAEALVDRDDYGLAHSHLTKQGQVNRALKHEIGHGKAYAFEAPRWFGKVVTHADFVAAAQTESFDVGALLGIAPGMLVEDAYLELTTEFSGGGATSCVAKLGPTALLAGAFVGGVGGLGVNVFTGAGAGPKGITADTKGVYLPVAGVALGAPPLNLSTPTRLAAGEGLFLTLEVGVGETTGALAAGECIVFAKVSRPSVY